MRGKNVETLANPRNAAAGLRQLDPALTVSAGFGWSSSRSMRSKAGSVQTTGKSSISVGVGSSWSPIVNASRRWRRQPRSKATALIPS